MEKSKIIKWGEEMWLSGRTGEQEATLRCLCRRTRSQSRIIIRKELEEQKRGINNGIEGSQLIYNGGINSRKINRVKPFGKQNVRRSDAVLLN